MYATYQPFYPEQHIEFYSLNNVYVLLNNTAYSLNSIRYTGTQQIHTAYSNQLDTAYLSSDTDIVDEEITMAKPNDYISATRKNFVSNDNVGRMVEKSIIEIQGTFLVKIRKNAFNGNIGENAFKHIDKFLEVVEAIKINGLTQDRFRLSVFPISLAGAASEWFTKKFYHLSDNDDEEETDKDDDPSKTNDVPKIFKIEDLFTFMIQGTKAYEEYESNNHMTGDLGEPWSENGVPYQLCDHICEPYHFKNRKAKWPTYSSDIDGFCNGGELLGMVRVGGMTYFQDHKCSFENFHELDHDVLTKLEECWWKVNAHEVAPFARWENFGQGPYANFKTKKTYDPYLDVNCIFGRNYEESNAGDTQDNQGHEERRDNPTHEPSVYKVRRFEMMKYSFNADEEYIAIKEIKYLNHSKYNLDAYRELL
ncbi:hypothetical protein Tco_0140772 [Tanacetum coccineum]